MKKSRIILPAAALLALSSAAAVTGTVAWFTANRIKTVGFSGVTAVNPEQGLNMTQASSLVNCTRDVVDGIETISHYQLRDASYDASDLGLYKAILDDETGEVVGYATQTMATADTKKYNGQNVYFATQFVVGFTVSRVESAYDQSLMIDLEHSSVDEGTTDGAEDSIHKALRISLKAGSEVVVWAPYTDEATVKNVSGAKAAQDPYNSSTIAAYLATAQETTTGAVKGAGAALPDDSAAAVARDTVLGHANYLGQLTTTALNVTVTTWFEGLDADCKNEAVDLAVAFTASLQFTMCKTVKAS